MLETTTKRRPRPRDDGVFLQQRSGTPVPLNRTNPSSAYAHTRHPHQANRAYSGAYVWVPRLRAYTAATFCHNRGYLVSYLPTFTPYTKEPTDVCLCSSKIQNVDPSERCVLMRGTGAGDTSGGANLNDGSGRESVNFIRRLKVTTACSESRARKN